MFSRTNDNNPKYPNIDGEDISFFPFVIIPSLLLAVAVADDFSATLNVAVYGCRGDT